ncbi:hypothetical protein Pelo_16516 [Pelomyxa schiedti]|nr:hypothetical protein Pelo_16516 [Pelomyxa schiedti]
MFTSAHLVRSAPVHFVCWSAACSFGDTLAVLGNRPQLGAWLPQCALRMECKGGVPECPGYYLWELALDVDKAPQLDARYKYVVIKASGEIVWESCGDRPLPLNISSTCDVFDSKALRAVPGVGLRPAPFFPEKCSPDGTFRRFPGNTVISFVDPNVQSIVSQGQSFLSEPTISQTLAPLPPSSFHMTVFDLKHGFNIEAPWYVVHEEMALKANSVLKNFTWSGDIVMNFDHMHMSHLLILRPANQRTADDLAGLRAQLSTATGVPCDPTYQFHISIAYPMYEPSIGQRVTLNEARAKMTALFTSQLRSFVLPPPTFCTFEDMTAFKPGAE